MYLPDWVQQFKEPRTEIRLIKGTYYKYEVRYQYSKEKKRTEKKTVRLLGKIIPDVGFVPSDKDRIRRKSEELPNIDIKTYGLYYLFSDLLSEEIASLREIFSEETVEKLLSFSMMRWAYQSPIKRAVRYHAQDYCSEYWSKESLSDKQISQALKHVGQNREVVVSWMRSLLGMPQEMENTYLMMDSTHTPSLSDKLAINAKGYNPSFDFDKQLRLMYLFSSKLKQPVYYRLINGNITDVKSMSLCVKELGVDNVIFVADKGFFSQENIDLLDQQNLQYIIPLRRNNPMIDYSPLLKANPKKEIGNYFLYQNRIIWYYQYEKEGKKLITFLDEKLRVEEEADYLRRIQTMPEKYSEKDFFEKLHTFGTLTMVYKIKKKANQKRKQEVECTPIEIYETYKQRNEIEVMFDSYKNYLDADVTYMQDRYVLEGWLLANFIAMIAYYKLFSRLKQAQLLGKYSPKDIIELSKAIHMIRIRGTWIRTEITEKATKIFKKIGLDYLT